MADQKVSDLPSLNGADVDPADLLYIIDSSAGSAGSKKITVGQYQLAPVSGGTANGVMYLDGSKVVTTGTGLVFDGTNLGIGTSSPGAKLHVKVGTDQNLLTTTVSSKVTNLAVNDAGSTYVDWQKYANQFLWFTASTERMRLDISGNLGIGISSPQAVLHVNKATSSTFRLSASNVGIDIQSLDGAGYGLVSTYTNHPMVFSTNATERARITSDGKLALGWTEARADLDVGTNTATAITKSIHVGYAAVDYYGFRIANTNTASSTYAGKLIFQRGNGAAWVDAMTIGDGGDVFVGTTNIPSSTNAGLMFALDANGTFLRNACTITASRTHFEFVNGNGTVGTIATNASATAYNTSSDRRLKTNIAPAADAGAVIDAIEVVQHDWKVGGHTRYGVIAQDLNAVAPEAVSAGDDGDEIEKTWGVDYSKLVPMLIKEIQTLRARVAALESA